MNYWKLGCRWGKKSKGKPLFFDLLIKENIVISWDHLDFGKGSTILLTDGFTPLGIAKTLSQKRPIQELIDKESYFKEKQIYFEEGLMYYKASIVPIQNPTFSYDAQQGIIRILRLDTIKEIRSFMKSFDKNILLESSKKILQYKKQIILQGPPGTGKTKIAKEIASKLLIPEKIEIKDIVNNLKIGQEIITISDRSSFVITEINDKEIIYKRNSTDKIGKLTYIDLQKGFANKIWENVKNGSDTYSAGVTKYLYDNYHSTERFKIIQFHPSFSYEDFVRGIISKPSESGESIVYEAENKILAKFAKVALENYKDSQKDIESKERVIIKTKLERFIDHIQNILDGDESDVKEGQLHKYMLTDNVYIFESDDKRFKYKGDNWLSHPKGLNMKYSEIEKIIASNVKERSEIKKISGLDSLTKSHATYFKEIIDKYDDFVKTEKVSDKSIEQKQILKNYVLIIDEINRANLSSVLGELIYALEYRGKSVESIYAVEENNELVLPPNLYIIGTMNTADRSVGHIDYAIRRRFAFIDVLPKNLKSELGNDFDENLFVQVANLFIKNYDQSIDYSKELKSINSEYLNSDFDPKDVWLGHSYFIRQYEKGDNIKENPYDFSMRLDYEIKPILLEYVKDGILKETAKKQIELLKTTI